MKYHDIYGHPNRALVGIVTARIDTCMVISTYWITHYYKHNIREKCV